MFDKFTPQITSPAPPIAATCEDAGPAPKIDISALSKGRPDGVYFAGVRLTPWLTFEERVVLSDLEYHWSRTKEQAPTYHALKARREGESIVVRWEIERGIPSAPRELWDIRTSDLDHDHRQYSYLWGTALGHVDTYKLGHRLIDEAVMRRERESSSNAYINRVMALLNNANTVWVIPAAQIVAIVAEVDLRAATKKWLAALERAHKAGVDVQAVLDEGERAAMKEAGGL